MTELEQLRGECAALREALTVIKTQYGQVCENFMTCNHPACTSSYSCWATADEALASSPLSEKSAEVIRLSTKLREAMTATEASSGLSEWSLVDRENCLFEEWKTAVDALQEEE